MKRIDTEIEGLIILEPTIFQDNRGYFFESYNKNVLESLGIENISFIQDNQSMSKKNVIRGLHFQSGEFAQDKLVRVVNGSVLDVAVDIRKNSKTYGKHVSVLLSSENKKMFLIPKGFAHGFLSLEDNTILNYKCSNLYSKNHDFGLLWNDKTLNIEWGVNENDILISDKDKINMSFSDFNNLQLQII